MDASVAAPLLRAACSRCSLRELCLPMGLARADLDELDRLVSVRRRVPQGSKLLRAGAHFDALFAVRSGFMKSTVLDEEGREQVVGFHMAGEIVGLDGIDGGRHRIDVAALEDTEACVIPYQDFAAIAGRFPELQAQLARIMSREIARDHQVMLLLGSFNATERVSTFLLNLSERYAVRGYSPEQFVLRMTRADIGSYVGVTFETVSRTLSHLQGQGVVVVDQKSIRILDRDALQRLASRTPACA